MASVLTVNAGSSSLKLALLADGSDDPVWAKVAEPDALIAELGSLGPIDAVGHRIVHGGERFREAVLIDRDVRAALDELTALAPLHQPKSLAALDAVTRALPDVPAVACFDTAFHATLPPAARAYALPAEWVQRWGLRRYGFHGLSHAYIARVTDGRRVVSAHLGAGASLCAINDGRSVDTTMGFTPLEGLVMATRSGSVDPGLLLWLVERTELSEPEIADALEHASGLLGLSGSADMRAVLDARERGGERATLAVDVYVHRLRSGIAAMAASLGGVDVVVFTGGVGENAAPIRDETVAGLGFLGEFRVLTVTAREDLEIARQVRDLLPGSR